MGLWESSLALPESGHRFLTTISHASIIPTVTPPATKHHAVYTDLLTFAFRAPRPYDDHQPIYIDAEQPSRFLSARQFRHLVQRLIAGLQAHNVQKGDCVLVHLGNNVLYSALFFAIIGAGGVYMGSNPRSQPQELNHVLDLAEPKLIITGREALSMVMDAATARGMLPGQVCLLDDAAIDAVTAYHYYHQLDGTVPVDEIANEIDKELSSSPPLHFTQLLCHGQCGWMKFNHEATAKATPAAMYTTSGTSGLPKAAVLSHHSLVSHHLSLHYDVPYYVSRLISLPMFHLFAALFAHVSPIRYGSPLFVLRRFEPTQFLSTIHRYQITETYMVPAMVHTVNRGAIPGTAAYLSSLRYVGVAGAPIDRASMDEFRRLLHAQASASQLWGMTEAGVAFQTRYGEHSDGGSIGRLLPGYEIRLLNSDGRNVTAQNEAAGELYVRGPGLLSRYKGRDDAVDAQGWFRTGDVAYVKNGFFYIVGRTKELIKVRGWQVTPAELEATLLQHPCISDAAVTGVLSRDASTELPRAFVVRAKTPAGARLTAEEVYLFARRQLASYKALDGGIVFIEEIPRTPSGKIQRFKLSQMNSYREMVASLLSSSSSSSSSSSQEQVRDQEVESSLHAGATATTSSSSRSVGIHHHHHHHPPRIDVMHEARVTV